MSRPSDALSEAVIARSLVLNIFAGSVGMFWAGVALGMPLPLYMSAIGATGEQLGAIGAIRQFCMIAQVPAAFIVERMAARKPFWGVVVTGQRLLWLVPALLPIFLPGRVSSYAAITIVALGVGDLLANLGNGPWMSWMADLIPPERSGRFWGGRQRVMSAALVVASVSFGLILDHFPARDSLTGFMVVFGIAGCAGTGDILIHSFVAEPRPLPHPRVTPVLERLLEPLRDPGFRRLTWALGAWSLAIAMPGISNGLPGFFNVVYLKENFHVSYSQASLLLVASAVGGILLTPRIGHAMDRFGARRVACWLMVAGPAATLAWFFVSPARYFVQLPGGRGHSLAQAALLMSAASVLIGGMYSGVFLCQLRLSQMHTQAAGRSVQIAVHWSLVGLIASAGPLAAGAIKDHFPASLEQWKLPMGASFSYFQAIVLVQIAIIWFVAIPLLRGVPEPVTPPGTRA